jgi:hypothetical protein
MATGQLLTARHWKDHFKNDLRSDQDQRLKIDLRSRLKKMILDQDHTYIIFCPKSPLFKGHFWKFLTRKKNPHFKSRLFACFKKTILNINWLSSVEFHRAQKKNDF